MGEASARQAGSGAPAVIVDDTAMPAVIVEESDAGLPPLAGEATAITVGRGPLSGSRP